MAYQLDISLTNPHFFVLPKDLPGVRTGEDFITFIWQASDIDPSNYTVVVEANDAAGPRYRSIGPLSSKVALPHVKFGSPAKIGVVPKSSNYPAFEGLLNRGSTYVLPVTKGKCGVYRMDRYGMERP